MTADKSLMESLHNRVAQQLLEAVDSGECSAQLMGVAVKFLKDNNITAVIQDDATMAELQKRLEERARKRAPRQRVITPVDREEALEDFSFRIN